MSELNLYTVMGLAPTWTWLLVLFFKLQLKVDPDWTKEVIEVKFLAIFRKLCYCLVCLLLIS